MHFSRNFVLNHFSGQGIRFCDRNSSTDVEITGRLVNRMAIFTESRLPPRALLSKTCTQPYFGSMSSFMRSEFVYGHRKYTSLCKSHGQIYRSTTSPCASFPKTRRIPFFGSMNSFPWSELMYGHRKYTLLCKSLGQIYRSPTSPCAF